MTAKTLLLVEDEALIAMSESMMLTELGYAVIVASSAEQALAAVAQDPIDLVLMDIDLGRGKLDGTIAASRILESHDLPIVFLSSHTEPEIVERTEAITSYGYILKGSARTVIDASIKMAFRLHDANTAVNAHATALAESETRFREVFNNLDEGVAIYRAIDDGEDFEFIDLNKKGLELGHLQIEDVVGRRITDILPGIEEFGLLQVMQEVHRDGTPRRHPLRRYRDDRIDQWYENYVFRLPSGLIIAAYTDQTQRKQLEAEYDAVARESMDGFCRISVEGKILSVNPAYRRMSGYTDAELRSMSVTDLDATETGEDTKARIESIIRHGIGRFSTHHRRKDGSTFPVEVRAITVRRDDTFEFVTFFREGSSPLGSAPDEDERDHRHYLERELYELVRTDPRIFDFLQEKSLDGIWYWDLEHPEREWMSPRFWELLGYDPEEKRHDPAEWQAIIDPEHLTIALDNFRNHLEDPTHPYDQIVRYTHKDGSDVWVRCRGMAIRNNEGTPIRMLGAHNDLSELKRTSRDLALLLREMNHRVKNNLAIVQSLISLKQREIGAAADLSDIERQIDAVRLVHEQLQHAASVGVIDAEEYLSRIVDGVFHSSTDGAIRTEVNTDGGSIPTSIAVALGLIVNELATNARKHGFRRAESGTFRVDVREHHETGTCELTVSNTGGPFPADIDIDAPRTLGLQIVRALVSQLDGTIQLTREPHPVFTIRFGKSS